MIDSVSRPPITTPYYQNGMCPVNVHWHLGTEHYSLGQYDEDGSGPPERTIDDPFGEEDSRRLDEDSDDDSAEEPRRLGAARLGFRCHKYNDQDSRFTKPYEWKHCVDMYVGETYEVHWPHSAAGQCGTPWQYQTPFYDGVFCKGGVISLGTDAVGDAGLNTYKTVGVQGQIFTIINDESYYYPDLFRGMIVGGDYGKDMAYYTGSTTGTSRDNKICSKYTPITWQVDRTCHLISASSFDKMCFDMKQQADSMASDLHAHGSRVLVNDTFAGNNLQRRV